jgi:hypothetical protein
MTTAIEFIAAVTAFVALLTFLGWLCERLTREDPLEKLERRYPKTRGFER